MAGNTLKLKGFFGVKETYNVTAATVTTGWYAGQLFKLSTAATSIAGDFVALCSTSGSATIGMAMENSSDVAGTPALGMSQPSGSRVTLLRGPAKFEIVCTSTTKPYEHGSTKGNMEAGALMDLLFVSANGKFTNHYGTQAGTAGHTTIDPQPIGFVTKVPTPSNGYTFGVYLFG